MQENLAIVLAATDGVDAGVEGLSADLGTGLRCSGVRHGSCTCKLARIRERFYIEEANQLGRYYPPTVARATVLSFNGISGPGTVTRRLVVVSGAAGSVGVVSPRGSPMAARSSAAAWMRS